MKIKSIIFILIASVSVSYSVVGAKESLVVISHNAPIYNNFADSGVIGKIDMGVPIALKSRKGMRVQFEYKGENVWIDQQNVGDIEFTQKDFSSTSEMFTPLPIVKEDSLCFVYDNKLYTMNISDPENLSAKVFGNIPQFSQISASEDRSVLLLTGDVVSNETTYLNLAFYSVLERKFYPLTFLSGSQISIESSEFSQNGKYLSLLFDIEGENIFHVYDVKTQTLLLTERNIQSIFWYDSILFVSTSNKFIYYSDLESQQSETLHTFSKSSDNTISSSRIGGENFFLIEDVVYRFDEGSLQKTDFRSLERSPRGHIEFYSRNDQTYTLYKNQRLRSFSGYTPRWTLLSILDDENILYRYNKDAIQMFSLYNAEQDQSYTYYWIEEPYHTFKSGVSLEYVLDGDEVWLFLEKPDDFVTASRIKDIIK